MDEKNFSDMQSDFFDFEKRFVLWQQRYEQHLKLMNEHSRRMKGFHHQLALYEQERRNYQERQEVSLREIQEAVSRIIPSY